MNIAILIGVTENVTLARLPACEHDVIKMRSLLEATGKYSDILAVTTNTTADKLKDIVRAFFSKHQNKQINEALFYFSGHGTFRNNEVLLCCSDYSDSHPTTTSLTNNEIDDLLRSVAPSLAVKLLDACRSGVTYIKKYRRCFRECN